MTYMTHFIERTVATTALSPSVMTNNLQTPEKISQEVKEIKTQSKGAQSLGLMWKGGKGACDQM